MTPLPQPRLTLAHQLRGPSHTLLATSHDANLLKKRGFKCVSRTWQAWPSQILLATSQNANSLGSTCVSMTRQAMVLADIAQHGIGCHFPQETRVQHARLDNVVSKGLADIARHVTECCFTLLLTKRGFTSVTMTWQAIFASTCHFRPLAHRGTLQGNKSASGS